MTTQGTQKPLQLISWDEKVQNNFEYFHQMADYYIRLSRFGGSSSEYQTKMATMYGVYNNRYPAKWFSHITNPLNARNPNHKNYPAKIRPVNILRTNLDYLMNEFPLRPFQYHVTNLSPDAVNTYEEQRNQEIENAIQQMWDQWKETDGQDVETIDLNQKRAEFQESYRDKLASFGQDWLNRTLPILKTGIVWSQMFKDWVIAGEAHSFKGFIGSKLYYERVSPLDIDYGASEGNVFTEDAEWVVRRQALTVSDIVDRFYLYLDKEQIEGIDGKKQRVFTNARQMSEKIKSHGFGANSKDYHATDTRFIYHVQWKGKKRVAVITEVNALTGQLDEVRYDEDHPFTESQKENLRWEWANEVYETWKLAEDVYALEGAPPVQRNEINNFSACKLNYNGRMFSDTHAENISPSEIGLPYQIMYMIINRTLELTIAKSKGKILLIDKNSIPDGDGWDEEKFFYYSEALGFGLLDRSQLGVDKSWNQYTVVDMTLFDSIKQLIELQRHYKQEWDDIIGINRQTRGNMMASDGKGVTDHALNQSSIVTDGIFRTFEELQESDLNGLLDFAKYDVVNNGGRAIYLTDQYEHALMDIDPDSFAMASLGVIVERAGKTQQDLDMIKAQAGNMLQQGIKLSTVAEVITERNLHRLKARLRQVEEIEAQMAQQSEELKNELEAQLIDRQKGLAEFQSALDINKMNLEYDRKEDLEMIKGSFNTFSFQDGDSNDNGVPDTLDIQKAINDSKKVENDRTKIAADIHNKREDRKSKEAIKMAELQQKEKDSVRKLEGTKIQAKAAAKRASASKAKKKS